MEKKSTSHLLQTLQIQVDGACKPGKEKDRGKKLEVSI